jgi:hypothetical protein
MLIKGLLLRVLSDTRYWDIEQYISDIGRNVSYLTDEFDYSVFRVNLYIRPTAQVV